MSRFNYLFLTLTILSLASGFRHPASAQPLSFPWVGGMNSCQFCTLDMNLDGVEDLLVFDRHGNRRMTWIKTAGGFNHDPAFESNFPDLHDWVVSADYNCDGKKDLFTYSLGGTRVFENISGDSLEFRLETNLLTSYYYSGYVGILLTSVDYPAIADIDGDGDLDLLTFFGLGSYVEYHQNQSMEKFGNCDSLDFRLAEHCWGNFKESEGSNALTLNITCPYKFSGQFTCSNIPWNDDPKHTGSTMLAADLDGNGVMDLVLGDVDFPNLIALINGGTKDSAHMVSQDTLYPTATLPVRLFSFPSSTMIDINNDGLRDLVISPFDPGYTISENKRSVWVYLNTGSNSAPLFQFHTDSWLQDRMLDFGTASYPLLTDLDGDGHDDLLVGNLGYYDSSYYENLLLRSAYTSKIAWLRNTGTGFTLVSDDLAAASETGFSDLYPAAGDLDGDGAPDLLAGQTDGTLIWFRNKNAGSDPPLFDPAVVKYKGIDVGNNSAPQLFDLDRDGLTDLIIGEQNGNLNYYRNEGTPANAEFLLVTDSLGGINVTNPMLSYYGYSTPCFFRGSGGSAGLLVGSEEGKIHYFKNIDGNLTGTFTRCDTLSQITGGDPFTSKPCLRSAPAAGFITDMENPDILAGNFSGGLNYYSPRPFPQVMTGIHENNERDRCPSISAYPNPAGDYIAISATTCPPGQRIRIFSSAGVLIHESAFSCQMVIPTTTFPPGLFLVQVTTSEGMTGTTRFIVIR